MSRSPDTTEPALDTIVVVNIFACVYSGSTWLNLMLGSHSEAFSVGEIEAICRGEPATCGVHGSECGLWSRFDPTEEENLLVRISRLAGKRYLVLSNPRNSLPHQQDSRIESRSVHLVRDGRAVAASMLRKHPERTALDCARHWRDNVAGHRRLLREREGGDVTTVNYERLQADTDGELERVCLTVGLPFEPAIRQFWRGDHHYLWGNRGTLFAMQRMRNQDARAEDLPESIHAPQTNWDLDYYRKTDTERFVDERWRTELSPRQRLVFALAAGRLNRKLGYDSRRLRGGRQAAPVHKP